MTPPVYIIKKPSDLEVHLNNGHPKGTLLRVTGEVFFELSPTHRQVNMNRLPSPSNPYRGEINIILLDSFERGRRYVLMSPRGDFIRDFRTDSDWQMYAGDSVYDYEIVASVAGSSEDCVFCLND